MQLTLLVIVVLIAFAANSVLGRMAIGWGYMDAMGFGLWRLASGAAMLVVLCWVQGLAVRQPLRLSLGGGAALTLYMVGFCLAYQGLDAGLGALILFGVVQIAMFGWGRAMGAVVGPWQLAGVTVAFLGLAYVVWPTGTLNVSSRDAALMGASGLGWAAYSLLGRQATIPVSASAVNFLWATAMMAGAVLALGVEFVVTWQGLALAVVSGALTSGLGYALWYRVLPQLQPTVAATVQLSVPIIAIVGGVIFLAEPVGFSLLVGTVTVLGGIALVIWAPKHD